MNMRPWSAATGAVTSGKWSASAGATPYVRLIPAMRAYA
jgi:hypothetical protein